MANAYHTSADEWVYDNADSILRYPPPNEMAFVASVRWVSATQQGDIAEIQDADGKTLWKSVASGAGFTDQQLLNRWWKTGFKVTTLSSGTLFINLQKGMK